MRGGIRWHQVGVVAAALVLSVGAGVLFTSCGKGSGPQQVASSSAPNQQPGATMTAAPAKPAAPKAVSQEQVDMANCRTLIYSGKYEQAVSPCEDIVKKYPQNGEAKYLLAYALQRTSPSRYGEAAKLYGQAETLGFDKFWIHYNRGLLYLWGIKNKAKAKADLKRALALDGTGTHTTTLTSLLKSIK